MGKNNAKIIKFEQKHKEILSNDEIMKVFGGLVRLVQKSAEYNAVEKVRCQFDYYIKRLNETTAELNKRNNQVNELLKLNEDLIRQLAEEK
jgi:hypothetical protein